MKALLRKVYTFKDHDSFMKSIMSDVAFKSLMVEDDIKAKKAVKTSKIQEKILLAWSLR